MVRTSEMPGTCAATVVHELTTITPAALQAQIKSARAKGQALMIATLANSQTKAAKVLNDAGFQKSSSGRNLNTGSTVSVWALPLNQ